MEEFYSDWRRRFVVQAALLLAFSIALGFAYRDVLQKDDLPFCTTDNTTKRICDPKVEKKNGVCEFDDACLSDTVLEHRWRSAHQQGLLHALLLLGFAIAAPYFGVGRFIFRFAGWLVIVGCWAAPLGATIYALGTTVSNPTMMYCAVEQSELSVSHCMANTIGAIAGITTGIALIIVALRSAWEALRDGIAPTTWRNWARTLKARPRRIENPATDDEIVAIVDAAIRMKTTVRAFGGRYSWSAIAPTEGIMIDMRRLRAIGAPAPINPLDHMSAAAATHTVRVGAGARIRDLTRYLMHPSRNLMLQESTVNPWIQVGGALANGCHGTGVDHMPLTDLVTSIEIVQAQRFGTALQAVKRTYSRPLDPEYAGNAAAWREWRALILNLGCLGVMHAVTFECVPISDAHIVDTSLDMRNTIDNDAVLRQIAGGASYGGRNEYAEIFWFPFNDEIFVRSWNPDDTGPHGDFGVWFWVRQWLVAKLIGPPIFIVVGLFPFITPYLMRIFHMAFSNLDERVRMPNAMQYERYFTRVYDMGYAIGYDPNPANPVGFEQFRRAWWQVVEKIENAQHRAEYPQNLVLHVRFGRESQAFLHPNRGNAYAAYMEIVTHVNTSRHQDHFEAVERAWHRLGGKSHWGKVTHQPDRLIENYDPLDVAAFLEVRHAMDPGQIFLNDYVRRILHVEE